MIMNKLYKIIGVSFITCLCLLFNGCELQTSAEWDDSVYTRLDKTKNAYEWILSVENDKPGTFKDLISILDKTELDTLYSNPVTRTIFAPNDDAIKDFLNATSNKNYKWKTIEDVPVSFLEKMLKTHVIYGEKYLSTSPEVTEDNKDLIVKTMNHTALSIYRLADFRFRYVGEFTVTVRNSNFEPTNGALHIIDVLAVKDAMRFDDNFMN